MIDNAKSLFVVNRLMLGRLPGARCESEYRGYHVRSSNVCGVLPLAESERPVRRGIHVTVESLIVLVSAGVREPAFPERGGVMIDWDGQVLIGT
jgi:hypothetical protein